MSSLFIAAMILSPAAIVPVDVKSGFVPFALNPKFVKNESSIAITN